MQAYIDVEQKALTEKNEACLISSELFYLPLHVTSFYVLLLLFLCFIIQQRGLELRVLILIHVES